MKAIRFLSVLLLLCFFPICVFAMDSGFVYNSARWQFNKDVVHRLLDINSQGDNLNGVCSYYSDVPNSCFYLHLSYNESSMTDSGNVIYLRFNINNSRHSYQFNVDKNGLLNSDKTTAAAFDIIPNFYTASQYGQEIYLGLDFLNKEDTKLNTSIEITLNVNGKAYKLLGDGVRLNYGDYAASLTTTKPTTTKPTTTKPTTAKPTTTKPTTTRPTTTKSTTTKPTTTKPTTTKPTTTKQTTTRPTTTKPTTNKPTTTKSTTTKPTTTAKPTTTRLTTTKPTTTRKETTTKFSFTRPALEHTTERTMEQQFAGITSFEHTETVATQNTNQNNAFDQATEQQPNSDQDAIKEPTATTNKTAALESEATTKFKYTGVAASSESEGNDNNSVIDNNSKQQESSTKFHYVPGEITDGAETQPAQENIIQADDNQQEINQIGDEIILPEGKNSGSLSPQSKLLIAVAVILAASGTALIVRNLSKKENDNEEENA